MSTRVNPKTRKNNPTKVIAGEIHLSYTNVWGTKSISGNKPKYSASLLTPRDDAATIDAINAAIEATITEGTGKFGGEIPSRVSLELPLRSGDAERDGDAYARRYSVNTNSINAPRIVNQDVNLILDCSEAYSNCYGRVSINFYTFNINGNRDVVYGFGDIQEARDDEPLGGHVSVESELDAWDADENFLT